MIVISESVSSLKAAASENKKNVSLEWLSASWPTESYGMSSSVELLLSMISCGSGHMSNDCDGDVGVHFEPQSGSLPQREYWSY